MTDEDMQLMIAPAQMVGLAVAREIALQHSLRHSVQEALEIGALLNRAKDEWSLKQDGRWTDYLAKFPGGVTAAQHRMKVAKEFHRQIEGEEKMELFHFLGKANFHALKEIAYAPEPLKAEFKAKLEAGETVTHASVKEAVKKAREEEREKAQKDIDAKVKARYEADEARLRHQRETELANEKRIEFLQKKAAELENDVGRKTRQQGRLIQAKDAMRSAAIHIMDVVNGEEGDIVAPEAWLDLAGELEQSASYIRSKLGGGLRVVR